MKADWRSSKSDYWQLDGSRAILHAPRLRGMIDLLHPCRGLTGMCVDGSALVGWLMAVDVVAVDGCGSPSDDPWQIADVYIRGRDLVVTYSEPLEQPFNLQLYWRMIDAADDDAALDLICSIQTPLWEAHPGVTVCSSMFETPMETMGGALTVVGKGKWSYVEATRPGDFQPQAGERRGEFSGAYWRFGPQFMEKGVIRRLQLRGAFVARDDAATMAAKLGRELAGEEPALTA
ncbi:hypothetical protein [Lacipirellula limnantheis]|uniref:Uncharacterized protein n=1 Tax=Lacipirellula limnantheis TaxID=2528024 RepID=A0A517TTV6_9BACT|nr:hypothetical protein [Lacipirellula limnantheis]QDT71815.1 hypothetical protein I41_09760 [Lacipirellula limnantheis]